MAYIEKRKNKKGEVTSYRIRAYCGYDVHGKQMVRFKSWKPPENMSAKQAEKEVQRIAILFEEECAHGQVTTAVKFQKVIEMWATEYAELNHRSTTLQREHKYLALSAHYSFRPVFCNPAQGHENGLVEGLVGLVRRNFFVPIPKISSLEDLKSTTDNIIMAEIIEKKEAS